MVKKSNEMEVNVYFNGEKKPVKFLIDIDEDDSIDDGENLVHELVKDGIDNGFLQFEDSDGSVIYINLDHVDMIKF